MKLIVQIDYKFLLCKHFKLAKRHTTSNIQRKTTTYQILCTKDMVGKSNFTSKSIFLYNSQRDKDLSTSKEKVRNGATSSQLNPQKISPKYKQYKPKIKLVLVKSFSVK